MSKALALLFLLAASAVFAQLPVTITSNTDVGTLVERIADAQRFAQTIQNAIDQLQTATQAVQYQIQALQSLDQGTWNGFVQAWNYETAVLNNVASFVYQLPTLSQIDEVAALVQTQGYKNAVSQLQTLQTNWAKASDVVHSTDRIVQNTQMRQQLWAMNQSNSQGNQSVVGQLQSFNQGLGLLGGEVADLNTNLGAWKAFWVAQQEQHQLQMRVEQQQADDFVEGNYGNDHWVYHNEDWESLDSRYKDQNGP